MSRQIAILFGIFAVAATFISAQRRPVAAGAQPPVLRVAAASDLQKAFGELVPAFEREAGIRVETVFGSSGLLAKQAEQGAPFDTFFSANERFVHYLETKRVAVQGTRTPYAVGRIVIWTRKGVPHPRSLADLEDPRYRRIAIANPEHAPYGAAAKDALSKTGVWKTVETRLVYGENVQQALQYARTGNVDVAIVALSVATGAGGVSTLVSDVLHAPIRQAACVLRQTRSSHTARRFIAFVVGPSGQRVMRRYGFTLPRRKP